MKCKVMYSNIPPASFLSGGATRLLLFLTLLFQVKELCALGFSDEARCHDVLRQSGGEVRGALALLQRPLLEPFHNRIWSDKPEPPVDIHHPDKQVRGPTLESHLNSLIRLSDI